VFGRSSRSDNPPLAVKIMVSGGFGVGKTTFVGAVSEVEPLDTEAALTEKSVGIDDRTGVESKTTTTVALDFGRITLDESLWLYLFGTPGQERYSFLWDDLAAGALGAVVMLDTRRIEDCFGVMDYFEDRGTPVVVAINIFEEHTRFGLDEIREALGVGTDVPIVECDARDRESVKNVLVSLIEQVLASRLARELADR
jgi:uncharacterized protein